MSVALYYGRQNGIARLKPRQFFLKGERKNYTSQIRDYSWKTELSDRMRIRPSCLDVEDVDVSRCDWVTGCFLLSPHGPRDSSGSRPRACVVASGFAE